MKITGIEIGEYRQFKNIKFDFTYPEGHPKAGEPLDKVCFIGQSGTGKTTLLNIIWNYFEVIDTSFQRLRNRNVPLNDSPYKTFQDVLVTSTYGNQEVKLGSSFIDKNADWPDKDSIFASSGFHWLKENDIYNKLKADTKQGKLCLYIDESAVNISKNLIEERENASDDIISIRNSGSKSQITENDINPNSIILSLNQYTSEILWSKIVNEIDTYDNGLKQLAASLVSQNSFTESRFLKHISEWRKEHPNPRADIARNCLNNILNSFYLEIDVDGTEARIVLKSKNGRQIPGKNLSTGAKQLISTSVPIFKLKLDNGVTLFDEPERSLFPDIQRKLIKHYTSLAPEAQFFFATHSPIVAASFEPCERFILYFNEFGEVRVRNGVAPIGDDPNDILRQDFGMNPLMQEEGIDAYQRYLSLATEIKNESDINRKMELLGERAELGNRYNFPALNETN